ncbi:MFS transporter [Pontivivens ytuae]|uniref:MFS transporter n=1 Tax=Pontivivens ytuae TaxID=2789856 RepID=A0A7S9QFF2_9RHOB|nr:MFS transporter [Pontivivens ytuae]
MLTPTILLLTSAVGVVGANSLMLGPIATTVAESFPGADAARVLQAASAYGLATALSALGLAPQVDRIGAGRVVLLALATLAVALAGAMLAIGVGMLIGAQVLAGLAAGAALPAIYSLTAEVALKGREAETLGIVLTGWTLALVAGVSLAAPISDFVHWRAVFGLLAGFAALIATALALRLERGSGAPGHRTSPLAALRVPGIGAGLVGVAGFMIAFYGVYTWLGPHVQQVLGRSTALTGLLPLAYGIGFGLAVPLDRMVDRWGSARMRPIVLAILVGVYVALALGMGAFWVLVALCLVWGLVNHVAMTLIVGGLTQLDPARRGAIMGLYSATTYLCVAVGVSGFRPIYEGFGLATAAVVSALCLIPALVQSLRRSGWFNGPSRRAGAS